ncbi:MAG: acylneuraminate cytidylyltransferase family protein [Planctomycetota bacterium]|jgi:CMP-N-acetylneuraminic acid synthetase
MTDTPPSTNTTTPADEVLGVIIGRAGSQGLPGKNALDLGGRPVVAWTIDDALEARTVGRVIVSTDCPRVAAAATAAGVGVVDRPTELAGPTVTVDAVVRHAVGSAGSHAGLIVILYANVPARPDGLIDRAVEHLVETGADSVQSYADVGKHHPWWMVRLDDAGRVEPFIENTVHRRQDLPPLLIPDGGVIAVRRRSLFTVVDGQPHAFLGADRRGIVSQPGAVIDIDGPEDFELARARLTTASGVGT